MYCKQCLKQTVSGVLNWTRRGHPATQAVSSVTSAHGRMQQLVAGLSFGWVGHWSVHNRHIRSVISEAYVGLSVKHNIRIRALHEAVDFS